MTGTIERFIERGTDYPLRFGKLTVFESNIPSKDIRFYFDEFILTLMVAGHKSVVSENLKFEFFPGTLCIPEKEVVNYISIPNATIESPTKCLALELDPAYLQSVFEDVLFSERDKIVLHKHQDEPKEKNGSLYFLTSDELLIEAFIRLYENQLRDHSPVKELVDELVVREMLLRLFQTRGLNLLKQNFDRRIADDGIRASIRYIRDNLQHKLSMEKLASVAGLGQTTFYKRFKECTSRSPADFIVHERITLAKSLIQKDRLNLQDIAYQCGFNSYEYFCSCFKRIEKIKPTEFKNERRASTRSVIM